MNPRLPIMHENHPIGPWPNRPNRVTFTTDSIDRVSGMHKTSQGIGKKFLLHNCRKNLVFSLPHWIKKRGNHYSWPLIQTQGVPYIHPISQRGKWIYNPLEKHRQELSTSHTWVALVTLKHPKTSDNPRQTRLSFIVFFSKYKAILYNLFSFLDENIYSYDNHLDFLLVMKK